MANYRSENINWISIIHGAIVTTYKHPEYSLFFELCVGSSISNNRIDAWAFANSNINYDKISFEFKVTRSDFKSELKHPAKRRQAMRFSNKYYFVCPPDLIYAHEVPHDCGLLWVNEYGQVTIIVQAPYRDAYPPTWDFLRVLTRRVDRELCGNDSK